MTIDVKIMDVKLQYNIHREEAKISALLIYEYLAGEEILPSDQSRIIEQAKFSKQVEALDVFKPVTTKLKTKDAISENTLSQEVINELNKIKEIEKRYT